MERSKAAASLVAHNPSEPKPNRSVGSNRRGDPGTVGHKEASAFLSRVPEINGGCGEDVKNSSHGTNQRPLDEAASLSTLTNSTPPVTAKSSINHVYKQELLSLSGEEGRGNSSGLGKLREPSCFSAGAPKSSGSGAKTTSLHRTAAAAAAASDTDNARCTKSVRSVSPSHITDGASTSVAPSLVAGTEVPSPPLSVKKKNPATVSHLGAEKENGVGVSESCDSLSEVMSPAFVGSPQPRRNRIVGVDDAAAAARSLWRGVETEGAANVESHNHRRTNRSGSRPPASQDGADTTKAIAATLSRRDVGPLPAPKAHTRNRLPSGTHIRRRPRSVARRHTSAGGETLIHGTLSTTMPGHVFSVSPAHDALDATHSSTNALKAPLTRQRGSAAASVGAPASGGGAVNQVGTGLTRDALQPGTHSRISIGGAPAAGHRRRADPSPAPSRPPRSRKARLGAAPVTPAGGSNSAAVSGPSFSQSSPAQPSMRVSHLPGAYPQWPKRLLSGQSSSGVSSPLNLSLERGSPIFSGDKDSINNSKNRSGRSGAYSVETGAAPAAAASAKPPSGRRQGLQARGPTLVHHRSSSSRMKECGISSPRQDYAKLIAAYTQLCAEVGDEPNMHWVAALSVTTGEKHHQDMLADFVTLSSAPDAKELITNPQRVPSFPDGSCDVKGHLPPPQQQQQRTPRGAARPRLASAIVLPSLPVSATNSGMSVSKRARTPGVRHGASSSNSQLSTPKRSGSAGRIAPVNRPSLFRSSTQKLQLQQHKHTSTGVDHAHCIYGGSSATMAPSLVGIETITMGVYAQRMSKYCVEHLQPFADSIKALKEKRAAVTMALQSFVRVAGATFTASAAEPNALATEEKSSVEGACQRSVVSMQGHHHGGHSNRGLGSGKSGVMPNTTASSLNNTPRKTSVSRPSTASSLSNTMATVTTGHTGKRLSAAAAAAAKAAALSDAIQTLQGAVVTLLSTLSDSAALAQAPPNGSGSSVKCVDQDSPPPHSQPLPTELGTLIDATACPLVRPNESASGPFARESTAVQLASPLSTPPIDMETSTIPLSARISTDACNSNGPPVMPQLTLANALAPNGVNADQSSPWPLDRTSPGDTRTIQGQTITVGSSATAMAAAVCSAPMVTDAPASSRFVEFVQAQKREVAVQLGELCSAVRAALGSPATPVVRLEAPDMLSTPFFVLPKYLDDLVIAMTVQSADSAAAVDDAVNATVMSQALDALPRTSNPSPLPVSSKNAVRKKLKSSKRRSSSGGNTTGRSSTSSSPRVNGVAAPYAPLFTFSMTIEEDEVGNGALGVDTHTCSVSARSTGEASDNAYASVESYLLHCVQPGAAAVGNAAHLLRLSTDNGSTSSQQSPTPKWITTDLSSKVKGTHAGGGGGGGGGVAGTANSSGSKQIANAGVVKSGRAGGGGGGSYQSRPALSTSQKAPATTAAAGGSKSCKNGSTMSMQLRQLHKLVKAWVLWTELKILAPNRDDAASAASKEPPSLSPRQSISSPVICRRLGHAPVSEENGATTPPPTSAPTAAATPAAGMPSGTRKWSLDNRDRFLSLSPSPPGTSHAFNGRVNGSYFIVEGQEEDDNDDDVLCSEMSTTHHPCVPESAASLSSLQGALQRLNTEDLAPSAPSDGGAPGAVSTQPSATALPPPLSTTQHHTVLPTGSVAAAARRIAVWWVSVRCFRHAVVEQRNSHRTKNTEQRQKVLAARRNAFVWLWVCRWRLRRRIEERRQQQQRQQADAPVEPVKAVADLDENMARTRRTAAGKKDKTTAETTTTAAATATSRERFQRSKEHRRGALASAAALTSSTARAPLSSPSVGSVAKDCASAIPASVSALPLATSGISTFDIQDYQAESSSFTVSAIHRLLSAPPSLLYTTCTVALRYPANAPMAYLDNSCGSAADCQTNGNEAREQSEAPPAADDLHSGMAGSNHHVQRLSESLQTKRDGTLPWSGTSNNESNSDHGGGANTAQQRRWIETGLLFIRFASLRRYVCGKYEVLVPDSGKGYLGDDDDDGALKKVDRGGDRSTLDGKLNLATRTYRGIDPARGTVLPVPTSTRYESIVDPNELHHAKPVVKPFHRPFEQWGMAYNLTSRVFCAAAIYAWQLIFSHTPFDDAKQRELPTREEQQARLERVEDRNSIILDCYGVRSEREWIREATKDLTFVGQIYLPSYDMNDPEQQQESRDNYDFVKNFLYQCFPSIHKLSDIQDYLVGAGLFFVLKEVFHYTKNSPSAQRMREALPQLVVVDGQDYIAAVTPATSALAGNNAPAAREGESSAAPPRKVADDSKDIKGLSGRQRAALHRFEQLRQLHHLCCSIVKQEKTTAGVSSGASSGGLQNRQTQSKSHQRQRRSCSPAASTKSMGSPGRESAKPESRISSPESNDLVKTKKFSTSVNNPASPLLNCIAKVPINPLSLMRATPVSATLGPSPFTLPVILREGIPAKKNGFGVTHISSFAIAAPGVDASVQLVRVPRRLLRPSSAEARFLRDFEEEVSKSIHGIIQAWKGGRGKASLDSLDIRIALMAGATLEDELDIAYPRHFLIKLSETLALELFGLQLSLDSCEDLDSMAQ